MSTDRVRGFPPFSPSRRRSGFARTWWGKAWVAAMEDTLLAKDLLTTGRRYAYAGQVGSITVSPGRLAAPVHDGDPDAPHQTRVFVEQLDDAGWDRFAARLAGTAGHIAALLEREMPAELVQTADDAGVRLLPTIGDLVPECTCPDWGHSCVHAAALCYQASWLLDADPLLLLLLRGRGERELLAALPRPRTAGAGTPAAAAYAQPVGPPPPLPPLPSEPAAASDPSVAAAAARAHQLLRGE